MQPVIIRVIVFALSLALAAIPSAWAGWGVSFDGSALRLDAMLLASNALAWGIGAFGLSGLIFAIWGTGGAAGLQRVALYVLSPLPPLIAVTGAGWGVAYDGGVIVIQIEALATAFVAGSGLSLGILGRWGVR